MTVASTTNRKSFSGDGVTTSFGTSPVVFYESTDLIVEAFSSTGTSTTLVENTNYTVSGGSTTGAVGTVNLAGGSSPYGAPAVGTTLLIRRVLPLVQEADFLNNDIYDAEVSETALDKLTMIAQQINETSRRGLNIPAVETATDALTVLPFDRASQYLAFDANKEMIASPGPAGDNVPVSTFMATVLDDTSAADARTTLGAAGSGAVTGSGLTMATARLLGRTTASTGAVEEISVSGATLSAGVLIIAVPAAASLAEQEAGTEAAKYVAPAVQQFHPSACKGWVRFSNAAVIAGSYNVTSVTDIGAGTWSVNWATDFSSVNYCALACNNSDRTGGTPINAAHVTVGMTNFAAGVTPVNSERISDGVTGAEPTNLMVAAFGDQ